jgi:hypothetical protein
MQREKLNRNFNKYWKNVLYKLTFQKMYSYKDIIHFMFSGFSIVFIGYIIINILNNYPPKVIGISP